MADIDIEQEANRPSMVSNDEGTVRERPLNEIIEADRYNQAKQTGATKAPFGLKVARLKPGGTL